MEIKTVFFDLDHTLWDFEKNSTEALYDLIDKTRIAQRLNEGADAFIKRYKEINHVYWEAYRKGEIPKEELRLGRFKKALSEHGIEDPDVHDAFAEGYIAISPEKTNLFPHALEVLHYLSGKYPMHIITNGFEEVQMRKLRNTGMTSFFKHIITSEMAGVRKPHPDIFRYALNVSDSYAHSSVMIGDEPEIDIRGGAESGMQTVFFNPLKRDSTFPANYTIGDLKELMNIL